MNYDPRCDDPLTPSQELEDLYWKYFTAMAERLHPGCLAIAKNPNISDALLSKLSIHTMLTAQNPLMHSLLLEKPEWVKRNINPKIIALAVAAMEKNQCLN